MNNDEIHAYQIGDSLCAPKFKIVEKPNGFIKNAKNQSGSGEYNKSQGERIEFWTRFNEVLVERGKPSCSAAVPRAPVALLGRVPAVPATHK